MSSQSYNFKRFWYPRTSKIDLSDDGYLYDPESKYGYIYSPDVVPFEYIMSIPCLVLLGEPGIGKTYAMQTERQSIDSKIKTEGGDTLWLDLNSFGSEDRLIHNLFENKTFVSWAKGKRQLHVFLDSLDECLLRIDNLAALLIDEFKKYPTDRLFLRIACRAADWPNSLEEGMKQLWEKDSVAVYELTPLRRKDISEAAEANQFDSEEFLREIDRKEIVPLAIKPITLNFLINIYSKTYQFPSTQTELYRQGCRLLCEETSPSRRDAGRTGALTAEERMVVAARIAAITVFANRHAIWTSFDQGNIPEEDVIVQELCGGNESINEDEFLVNEESVRETLATGLFSSRGPNRLSWVHQTYAEFLASHYLVQSKIRITQILNLMIYPNDPECKIIPQLNEVAAWLAGMVPDVFRAFIDTNPEILLRSDMATIDVNDRAKLIESLLDLYDKEKLLDNDFEMHRQFRKLIHPGLAGQIQPYLLDDSKGIVVRRVAIEIVEACELQFLLDDLVSMSLNPLQPIQIRVSAAYAINNIGDNKIKAKLKPLAISEVEEDINDELKGYGLRAVWPGHVTAEELFTSITLPKQESFFGAYMTFLIYDLVQHLKPIDLPIALKWVEEQGSRQKLQHSFEKLIDDILLKAWEYLDSPGVLETFAKIALSRLKHYEEIIGGYIDPPFSSILNTNHQKRREVLKSIVPTLQDPENDSKYLVFNQTPLVINKDMTWLIERFQAEKIKENQLVWAQLITKSFNWRESGHLDAVLFACSCSPILAENFQWLLKPVKLNSPEAQKMKDDYLERKKWFEINRDRPLIEPPPSERIAKLLDDFQSGKSDAWWQLNNVMTLQPDSTHYGDELESDLTILYGWKAADVATREKIVKAAKIYLEMHDPQTNKWLDKNVLDRPAFAGYRALRLLLKEDPNFISTIPDDIWKKWSPTILAYPTSSSTELIELAYNHAPNEIIQALMAIIDKENEEHNHIFVIQKVKNCWDERLANAILIKAKDKNMKPDCMGYLLSDLLENKVSEAKAFAESLVSLEQLISENERSRAVVAARMLMNHAEDCGWEVVWPIIQKDTEFGKEVISAVEHGFGQYTNYIENRLTEEQLVDLYIWVARQYPHAEDPKYDDANVVGSRESISNWRDSILNNLKQRGTFESCDAISRISSELPDLDWLKWTLFEAQNITRRNTWVPPQPRDILKMVIDQQMHNPNIEETANEILILEPNIMGMGIKLRNAYKKILLLLFRKK